MAIDLDQVILHGGERFVNFFEGRILTGRDLRDEQTAARRGRSALGKAIGWGVIHGLEVTDATPSRPGSTPAVRITPGLAINRDGQTLNLTAERTVRLAELAEDDPRRDAAVFGACPDQPAQSGAPTAEGFHLLTLAPATGYEEEAPKSGLGDPGTASGCARRYVTLGVRFRLVRFDPALLATDGTGAAIAALALASGTPALSQLRNLVAHLGLGTTQRNGFPFDPFASDSDNTSAWDAWGLEALLTTGTNPLLADCELPLAVLRLRGGAVSYIDMWSVRRRTRTLAQAADWPLIAALARRATDAATLFQFQDQLAWLFNRLGNPETATAISHFRYLPPVGLLPLGSPTPFLPNAQPPLALNPGRVIPLIEEALAYPAVGLNASPAPSFNTYRVTGTDNWILFVSDAVPSPELQAQKCAELEERLAMLEETLAAPGVVTGIVLLRYQLSVGTITNPVPGVTVRAIAADETETDAITDNAGRYTLTLPAGTYDLVPVLQNQVLEKQRVTGLEVPRGAAINQGFTLDPRDLAGLGGVQ